MPIGGYVLDGGSSTQSSVGTSPIALSTTYVNSPYQLNNSYGNYVLNQSTPSSIFNSLIDNAVLSQVTNLYSLGIQQLVVINLAAYPNYAVNSAFASDMANFVTVFKGGGPQYEPLNIVLYDGIENYVGYGNSATPTQGYQAYVGTPITAVTNGSSGNWTLQLTYQYQGLYTIPVLSGAATPSNVYVGAIPGTPVLQTGDWVYLDEVVGLSSSFNVYGVSSSPGISIGSRNVTINNLSNLTGLEVGLYIAVPNSTNPNVFPAGTQITGISNNVLTLSNYPNSNVTGNGINIVVGSDYATINSSIDFSTGNNLILQKNLAGPYQVTSSSVNGNGLATIMLSTGSTKIVALNPLSATPTSSYGNSYVNGNNSNLGGWIKTDTGTAINRGGYSSTASYFSALIANFNTVKSSIKTAWSGLNTNTPVNVGIGLTGTNWVNGNATPALSFWSSILSNVDFNGVSFVAPYTAALNYSTPQATPLLNSPLSSNLLSAVQQLYAINNKPVAVTSFDLYDPQYVVPTSWNVNGSTVTITYNNTNATNDILPMKPLATPSLSTPAITVTNSVYINQQNGLINSSQTGVIGPFPITSVSSNATPSTTTITVSTGATPVPVTNVASFKIVQTDYDADFTFVKDNNHYDQLTAAFFNFLTNVFNDDDTTSITNSMYTLVSNGLKYWNFLNDDYLNTTVSYTSLPNAGLSYNALAAATARYGAKQGFVGNKTISGSARILVGSYFTNPASSKIAAANSYSQSAGSRITTSSNLSFQPAGLSVITISNQSSLPAGSRISKISSNNQTASGRLAESIVNNQPASAKIALSNLSSLPAGSRVVETIFNSQIASGRLTGSITNNQPASSFLVAPTVKTYIQLSGARILKVNSNILLASSTLVTAALSIQTSSGYIILPPPPITVGHENVKLVVQPALQ